MDAIMAAGLPNTPASGPSALSDPQLMPNTNAYNVIFGFDKFTPPPAPVTEMTMGDVFDYGRKTLIPETRAAGYGVNTRGETVGTSAVGAYQITSTTMQDYGRKLFGDDWRSKTFTPEVQDQIAEAIFNDRKHGNLQLTWAGLPMTRPGAYKDMPWEEMRGVIQRFEIGDTGSASGQRGSRGTAPPPDAKPNEAIFAFVEEAAARSGLDLDREEMDLAATYRELLPTMTGLTDEIFGPLKTEGLDKGIADAQERSSDDYSKERMKEVEGQALLTMGSRLMAGAPRGTPQGNFMTAVGAAVQEALPGFVEGRDDVREAKRNAIRDLAQLEGVKTSLVEGRVNTAVGMINKQIEQRMNNMARSDNIAAAKFGAIIDTAGNQARSKGQGGLPPASQLSSMRTAISDGLSDVEVNEPEKLARNLIDTSRLMDDYIRVFSGYNGGSIPPLFGDYMNKIEQLRTTRPELYESVVSQMGPISRSIYNAPAGQSGGGGAPWTNPTYQQQQ
jgi:hypothetical protein